MVYCLLKELEGGADEVIATSYKYRVVCARVCLRVADSLYGIFNGDGSLFAPHTEHLLCAAGTLGIRAREDVVVLRTPPNPLLKGDIGYLRLDI